MKLKQKITPLIILFMFLMSLLFSACTMDGNLTNLSEIQNFSESLGIDANDYDNFEDLFSSVYEHITTSGRFTVIDPRFNVREFAHNIARDLWQLRR